MFKYLSRVRAALYESGVLSNRTTTTDQGGSNAVIQDNKIKSQLPCPLRLVPCFLDACQRQLSQFNIQNNEEQHKNSSDSKNNGKNSTEDSFRSENINYHQPCAVIGAVGWSGVLVLGWTILQPWYRHGETRKLVVENDLKTDRINRYCGLSKLLLHPAFSQPVSNSILPASLTKNDFRVQSSPSSTTPILPSHSEESEPKILTPKEAFDEAAEEVRRVHERVVGEAENRLGVACLSHKKNREAIEHFRIATANNNAPAAFNLGQCYELGIGTEQDFSQAAHWYSVASDMGHSMAMYNLGVFYAHGWGGLNPDSKRAKKLFVTAASLGQSEAKAALNLSEKNLKLHEETRPNESNSQSFESRIAFDFLKANNISLRFMNSNQNSDYKDNALNLKPDSSLPSSSSPSSTMSSSQSSSSSINEHSLAFNQRISTIDELSESCSETSSDNEWYETADIANMNGNSTTLYRLAVCYENSRTVDPELILQLYRMAADHGHYLAEKRLKVLEEHYALGTLDSYLRSIKKKTKYSSVSECSFHE